MILETLTNLFEGELGIIFKLIFFTTIIVIYSVFVFYFYRFLAKKNILELNLNQYNQYSNPTTTKVLAAFLYIIEYIILLPILTFFWFAILSILILVLAKEIETSTVLLISTALVAAVRATSYVSEDLSKDLAKMLPFTLLAIAITTVGFFNINELFQRTTEIPALFSKVPYYLIFIVTIELIMRITEFTSNIFNPSIKETEEEND